MRRRALCWAVVLSILLFCWVSPAETVPRSDVQAAWNREYRELAGQIERLQNWNGAPPEWWSKSAPRFGLLPDQLSVTLGQAEMTRQRLRAEALDPQALTWPEDRDPLCIVIRRTGALLQHFEKEGRLAAASLADFATQFSQLAAAAESTSDSEVRKTLFMQACRLRREIAMANPLLDFNDIVGMLEQPGDYRFIEQARASFPGHSKGGGPIVIRDFKSQPTIEKPLAGVPVTSVPVTSGPATSGPATSGPATSGPWQGRELTGFFSGLELSYNATELLLAATTDADIWHIFRFNLATKRLEQLTDGPHEDFDPHELPSGRIVFVSTRRGGAGRCVLSPRALTYTLYSMEPDGSDVVCLSFHETNEWQPTVSHAGKIVYTRWDYVDRHWGAAHHFWQCFPDGRDPRNYHGNYPLPWSAMPVEDPPAEVPPEQYGKVDLVYGRVLRPDAEISFRPVPHSPKYTATAVGHHEGFSGTLVLLDPRIPDDGKMAQLKRITPEYFFPEVEPRAPHAYGTAWPLSEDFYLCNFNHGLYLLDRFGNRELIYDPGPGAYRVRDPFPLRPRRRPPAVPVRTWQGERAAFADHRRAVISVTNVYETDVAGKLPDAVKAKWMRIVQLIPQTFDKRPSGTSVSQISFATDAVGRIPLGVVPVEEDGSVYCEAPVGKAIYFQLLDERGMAVHSMRSATYVHPGEHLSCQGCHEDKWKGASPAQSSPMALRRPPSKIVPEVTSGAIPFNFIQLVKAPVFDKKCVPCHREHPDAPDMSYASLARKDLAFGYPGEEPALNELGIGGSRTAPGRFGARASGIMKSLTTKDYHRDLDMSDDDWRRLTLWLDLNSNNIGWIGNDDSEIVAQKDGQALWPPIDVDRSNPTGVEKDYPIGSIQGR